jgi:protein XRP2
MDRCINVKLFIGPIRGSIFVRDSKNCTITVACSQFRCRDLYDSTVYLFCGNEPVIESSANVTFAPYNLTYPNLDSQIEASLLHKNINKWDLVFDFTKQESGELNFSIKDPKDWTLENVPVEGMEKEEPEVGFPYPVRYGGTIPDDAFFGAEDD